MEQNLDLQDFQVTFHNNIVSPNNSVVYIRNLTKSYNSEPPTLKNLNMTVNQGSIYGLLGSSGCGKTTLLSCIIAQHTWKSGELSVFEQRPGKHLTRKIGYMPQNLSLYHQLSTYETIQFYGKLYKLSVLQLEEKWKLLKTLLQLPSKSKLISDMSGGQRRRASLALALIHSPELLILDEPTVGLDPLLRKRIWNYMCTIVRTMNTTIVITTHYIEEARFCDTTGILRNGQIIAETAPMSLIQKYHCERLEDAILKLCHQNEQETRHQATQKTNNSPTNSNPISAQSLCKVEMSEWEASNIIPEQVTKSVKTLFRRSLCSDLHHSFEKVSGLTLVMALTLIRHPVFLTIFMVMPTILCCLTLATVGYRVKNLHFGVVNYDTSNWQTECVQQNVLKNLCELKSISCGFINKLQEDDLLILDFYENEQYAFQGAQMGEIWGYFVIPENYSAHLLDFAAEKRFASNETLEGSQVHFRLDHSQYLTAFFVVKGVYNAYFNFVSQLVESCGLSKKEFLLPLQFRPAVYGDYTDSYADYIFSGIIVWAIHALPFVLSALIFVTDYKQETLQRARIAGLNIYDIIISHIVIQSLITLVQLGIVTGIQYILFGFEIKGFSTLIVYLVICFGAGLTATTIGLLLGILFRDEAEFFVFGLFLTPFYLIWGCVFMPAETTTRFWQLFGNIIPTKVPISALRSALIRGMDITHALVWSGVVLSAVWTLLCSMACIVAFKALRL